MENEEDQLPQEPNDEEKQPDFSLKE